MKVAFYKGTRPGIAGIYNRFVRWWDAGPYSHVELIFSDGISASSSFADGGVRFKKIDYDDSRWDIVEIPDTYETAGRIWFKSNEGKPYDLLGNIGFLWRPIRGSNGAFFCSESICAALGFEEPWRYSPNALYNKLTDMNKYGVEWN